MKEKMNKGVHPDVARFNAQGVGNMARLKTKGMFQGGERYIVTIWYRSKCTGHRYFKPGQEKWMMRVVKETLEDLQQDDPNAMVHVYDAVTKMRIN